MGRKNEFSKTGWWVSLNCDRCTFWGMFSVWNFGIWDFEKCSESACLHWNWPEILCGTASERFVSLKADAAGAGFQSEPKTDIYRIYHVNIVHSVSWID